MYVSVLIFLDFSCNLFLYDSCYIYTFFTWRSLWSDLWIVFYLCSAFYLLFYCDVWLLFYRLYTIFLCSWFFDLCLINFIYFVLLFYCLEMLVVFDYFLVSFAFILMLIFFLTSWFVCIIVWLWVSLIWSAGF